MTYIMKSYVAVGNLAYDLSEQDVIDYFSQVGPVKSVRYDSSSMDQYVLPVN
jgi:RNA recognition motif-containing protein